MLQNRRSFVKVVGIAGVGMLTSQATAMAASKKLRKITILHTNDLHSQIDANDANHPTYPGMGGFARRAALINKVRQEEKDVLLLDAGDLFQGSPYFNFFKGELEIKLMNAMKYDAVTIGNHEFDNGSEMLFQQYAKAKYPIICANYEFENQSWKQMVKPYIVKKYGAIRVGILGLSINPEGLISPNNFTGIQYRNELEVANSLAEKLRTVEKCDFVIALTHLGIETDEELAKQSKHIDLILGGHSHTFLEAPLLVNNLNDQQVIINQMGWAGVFLGRIDVYFDAANKRNTHEANRMK